MRSACTIAGAPVTRIASRRKAAFLALLSTRWILAPGDVGERAGNRPGPGSPAPLPRSIQIRASGASVEELERVRRCAASRSRGTVELDDEIGACFCQCVQQLYDQRFKARQCFT